MKVSHSKSSKVLQVELIKEVSPSHGIGHVEQRPSRGFHQDYLQTAEPLFHLHSSNDSPEGR